MTTVTHTTLRPRPLRSEDIFDAVCEAGTASETRFFTLKPEAAAEVSDSHGMALTHRVVVKTDQRHCMDAVEVASYLRDELEALEGVCLSANYLPDRQTIAGAEAEEITFYVGGTVKDFPWGYLN